MDMQREAAVKRPGMLIWAGMETFAAPATGSGVMNVSARGEPIVSRDGIEGEEWIFFKAITPDAAIIRAATARSCGFEDITMRSRKPVFLGNFITNARLAAEDEAGQILFAAAGGDPCVPALFDQADRPGPGRDGNRARPRPVARYSGPSRNAAGGG
ncbi:hypothetical protein [Cribrihabitans pelagius]|uniref:hypothetical protein n=1 Tax=Cribrihabitans pelagius TaxID=1765746 RepID=UPI003B5C0B92